MPVTLKNRGGKFYAMGTLTLANGGKVVVRQSTGFTTGQRAFAEKRLAQIIKEQLEAAEAGVSGGHEITVEKAVARYMSGRASVNRCCANHLDNFVKRFAGVRCSQLDKVRVLEWAEAGDLRGKKITSGTARRRLTTVLACMNHVKDCGYNVADLKVRKPRDNPPRDRWIDGATRDRFLDGFERELYRDIATFLFFTGARLDECLGLRVEALTAEGVVLASRKGVGGRLRKRVVPLHPGLKSLLVKRASGLAGHELVFGVDGRKVKQNTFRMYWDRVAEKVGVEDFRVHDARHTFATLLAKTGEVDLQELAQLLGHENIQMTMRYRHLLPRRQVAGIDALGVIRTADAQQDGAVRKGEVSWLALSAA